MKFHLTIALFLMATIHCFSQTEIIPLWKTVPNQQITDEKEVVEVTNIVRFSNVQQPEIHVFLASKVNNTKKAVIICPGGGYGILAWNHEGTNFAKWLSTKGINAIVLKYRLPKSKSILLPHLAPLQDAQRAIRMVRSNAKKWHINSKEIGILGFSAGGHLASTAGTHFNFDTYIKTDKIDKLSAKPNFMGLIYPVISMQEAVTHKGSKRNLLGENPSKELVDLFSNELQVTADTPPTFIVHAEDDKAVPVKNSILFNEALKNHNIPSELHIYPVGGHGFGFGQGTEALEKWTDLYLNWLLKLDK